MPTAFVVSIIATAAAADSCPTISAAGCPVCRNVTIGRNFTTDRCIKLPNPLIQMPDGLCCPQQACTPWQCPIKCDADYSKFARATSAQQLAAQPPAEDKVADSIFDCSRTVEARECANDIIQGGEGGSCDCLARDCFSATHLLEDQSAQCVLDCQAPKSGATICSDYDDQQIWCEYYAVFQCVANTKGCEATKLRETTCESTCLGKSRKAGASSPLQLDAFLQCLGSCEKGAAKKETKAENLEVSDRIVEQ